MSTAAASKVMGALSGSGTSHGEESSGAARGARGGAVRHDLVRRIREEIRSGRYLTSDKLDACVDRMMMELA